MRVPAAWRQAIEAERLVLLSPFSAAAQRRQSVRLAERRNELVMRLAEQALLLHAAPDSQTAHLMKRFQQTGQPLLTMAEDDATILPRLTNVFSAPPHTEK